MSKECPSNGAPARSHLSERWQGARAGGQRVRYITNQLYNHFVISYGRSSIGAEAGPEAECESMPQADAIASGGCPAGLASSAGATRDRRLWRELAQHRRAPARLSGPWLRRSEAASRAAQAPGLHSARKSARDWATY